MASLYNGTPHAWRTLELGDPQEQQALAATYAEIVGVEPSQVLQALLRLIDAVEGLVRQIDDATPGPSQATTLVALATAAGVELFRTPEGDAYATIAVDGHTETWPLKVRRFRRWLADLFNDEEDKVPGSQAVQDALVVLEGKALKGQELPVYTRLAEVHGTIYLDLGNATWQVVEITPSGWQVVDTPPVKFRRARGMLALPSPESGGTLADLRRFVNVERDGDNDWRLLVSWLLATFRPTGPYTIFVLYGEQGSAKSSLVRILRALVDPNTAALRTTPRTEQDLVIAASNGWLIALDNLSRLPDWLSDALCRLATGGGFATRELYTDADEVIFAAQRPVVLNGITEIATRGDLLDRAITLYLPTIPDHERQDETAFWQEFEQARPQILGALLNIVSSALQQLPSTTLACKPRMADFALWSCAAAPACGWSAAEFLEAYQGGRDALHEVTLEASAVGLLVREFATQRGQWEGTPTALLGELERLAEEKTKQQRAWPKNGQALSNALRQLAPTLRAVGIAITFERERNRRRRRLIHLAYGTAQAPHESQTDVPDMFS
jgi:hypothetical protein